MDKGKILAGILAMAMATSIAVGCGSNNNDQKSEKPTTKTEQPVAESNIDWSKAIEATKKDIMQQEKLVSDVFIEVNQEKKSIDICLACNNAINQAAAAEAADTAVRRLSANAQMQDSSIKSGGKDYWGGIWDTYTLSISVAKNIDAEKRSNWLIDDIVQPGIQGKHVFKGLNR